MNIIAHRAWSTGYEENTIIALERSVKKGVYSVEIDVRRQSAGIIVLSHDKPDDDYNSTLFKDFLDRARDLDVELYIEFKECDYAFFSDIADIVISNNMQDKSFVFGFEKIASRFPWNEFAKIKKGVIVKYPWNIRRAIQMYKPHFIAMGWDNNKSWTKYIFNMYWSIFSLSSIKSKFNVKIMVGVCRDIKQIKWLNKQGVDYITVDMEYLQNISI